MGRIFASHKNGSVWIQRGTAEVISEWFGIYYENHDKESVRRWVEDVKTALEYDWLVGVFQDFGDFFDSIGERNSLLISLDALLEKMRSSDGEIFFLNKYRILRDIGMEEVSAVRCLIEDPESMSGGPNRYVGNGVWVKGYS